jgi:spore germination protein YaaH
MKNFLKSVRAIADKHGKKLLIGMDGVDPKPDNKINKKKAREIISLVDKVVIANYDCPRGNDGINIPISPMDWVKQNYEFYCEVYSKAKITPKLIMVPLCILRPFLSTDTLSPCMENMIRLKGLKCWRSCRKRSNHG